MATTELLSLPDLPGSTPNARVLVAVPGNPRAKAYKTTLPGIGTLQQAGLLKPKSGSVITADSQGQIDINLAALVALLTPYFSGSGGGGGTVPSNTVLFGSDPLLFGTDYVEFPV